MLLLWFGGAYGSVLATTNEDTAVVQIAVEVVDLKEYLRDMYIYYKFQFAIKVRFKTGIEGNTHTVRNILQQGGLLR